MPSSTPATGTPRAYAGEIAPRWRALARWCLANHLHLNVEIRRPGPGTETGRACTAS